MIRYNTKRYWGYSTDVKPINSQKGDRFLEIDTRLEYFFDDYNQWILIGKTDVFVTGGTLNSGTATFTNNTGGTFSVTGFSTVFFDVFVTGATKSGSVATFRNNTGGTFTLTGLTDTFVTGGTKSGSNVTFTNNTGGTFTVTGFTDTYVTGGTKTGTNVVFTNNVGGTFTVTGFTDTFVTGGTYSGSTIIFTDNTGGTFNVTGITTSSSFTGGTVTGATNFTNGLTANTISATTYQNLPATPFLPLSGGTVTGATSFTGGLTANTIVTEILKYSWIGAVVGNIFSYFNNTFYTNETGKTHYFGGGPLNVQNNLSVPNGSLQVGGNTLISSGLTANTISATTYFNLPTDVFVTGGTYSNGTATFTNNTGGTFNVTGITTSSQFTGGTVTGATNFTNGLTANTISATTYQNLPVSGLTQGSNITITNNGLGNYTISSSGGTSVSYGLVVATSLGYQNIF